MAGDVVDAGDVFVAPGGVCGEVIEVGGAEGDLEEAITTNEIIGVFPKLGWSELALAVDEQGVVKGGFGIVSADGFRG